MPIEIREIIIKTQIITGGNQTSDKEKYYNAFRKKILEECRTLILTSTKRKNYKR